MSEVSGCGAGDSAINTVEIHDPVRANEGWEVAGAQRSGGFGFSGLDVADARFVGAGDVTFEPAALQFRDGSESRGADRADDHGGVPISCLDVQYRR